MANNTLELVLTAKDEASAKLQGVGKSLDGLGDSFKKVGAISATIFAGVSALAVKTISDYADAEKSSKQLEHAVLNVSHATREQLKQTEALADALEKKGVLDGDNIKMGLAQLSTFGLSNKAVQALGGSLADLAVNQYGVSASGEDLSSTANMIAKALNGQFGVLEKSGIRFSEAQKQAIQFGTEMEKVNAINQGFAQNLKYTNDVALSTFEGKLAAVKVQLGNVSEGIGKALLPIVQELLAALLPMILAMTAWVEKHPELTKWIIIIVGAVTGLVAILGALAVIMPIITGAFLILLGPVGLIIAAIAAVIAITVLLVKNWDNIRDYFKTLWDDIVVTFKTAIDSIVAYFDNLLDRARQVIEKVSAISGSFGGVIKAAAFTVAPIASTIVSGVSKAVGKRATGGNVSSGSNYLVGENGPEMFSPSGSGIIVPNNRMNGSSNQNITINLTGTFLSEDSARKIGDMIIKNFKNMSRVGV